MSFLSISAERRQQLSLPCKLFALWSEYRCMRGKGKNMPRWGYTLHAKDLFGHPENDEENTKIALESAPIIIGRVERLIGTLRKQDKLGDKDYIIEGLEWVIDAFKEVTDQNEDPLEAFNEALTVLYDVGDEHRIWIK